MELEELLEQVPPLLEACIDDNVEALRTLRFVSKEASRVAMLALKTYTLTLKGDAKDTNLCGARLLRTARLATLTVHLRISGKQCQGQMVEIRSLHPLHTVQLVWIENPTLVRPRQKLS